MNVVKVLPTPAGNYMFKVNNRNTRTLKQINANWDISFMPIMLIDVITTL